MSKRENLQEEKAWFGVGRRLGAQIKDAQFEVSIRYLSGDVEQEVEYINQEFKWESREKV